MAGSGCKEAEHRHRVAFFSVFFTPCPARSPHDQPQLCPRAEVVDAESLGETCCWQGTLEQALEGLACVGELRGLQGRQLGLRAGGVLGRS